MQNPPGILPGNSLLKNPSRRVLEPQPLIFVQNGRHEPKSQIPAPNQGMMPAAPTAGASVLPYCFGHSCPEVPWQESQISALHQGLMPAAPTAGASVLPYCFGHSCPEVPWQESQIPALHQGLMPAATTALREAKNPPAKRPAGRLKSPRQKCRGLPAEGVIRVRMGTPHRRDARKRIGRAAGVLPPPGQRESNPCGSWD